MSLGCARANGAISVVNAIATGKGAALAIDLHTEARVELLENTDNVQVVIHGDETEDPALAREVVAAVCSRLGVRYGAKVETRSDIPVSRGLKSSSAAANAIALATNHALHHMEGRSLPEKQVLDAAIDAALKAGVTLTGAYDDASASFHGGLCVTDNRERKLLLRKEMPEELVAVIHVPPVKTHTATVKDRPYPAIAPVAARAHALALRGEWAEAMLLNGLAFGPLYEIPTQPVLAAREAGALAASVSGTGPALAAVADREKAETVAAALRGWPGKVKIVNLVNEKAEVRPC